MTRSYDDFEWLQQSLFSQEDVPGIQGVIVSPDDEGWILLAAWSSVSAAP